jgi:hypothetical protein
LNNGFLPPFAAQSAVRFGDNLAAATLDPQLGEFILTHPALRIPAAAGSWCELVPTDHPIEEGGLWAVTVRTAEIAPGADCESG